MPFSQEWALPNESEWRVRLMARGSAGPRDIAIPFGVFDAVAVFASGPDTPITVSAAADAGVEPARVLTEGLENTWRKELTHLDARRHELGLGRQLRVLAIDDSPYVSAAITGLRRILGYDPTGGAFVAAPRFSTIAMLPIESVQDGEAFNGLARMMRAIYESGQGLSLDPRVHWWDGHEIRETEIATGGDLQLTGPQELVTRLLSFEG